MSSSNFVPDDREAERLFREYARTRDQHARDQLIAMHQNLVRFWRANSRIVANRWKTWFRSVLLVW